MKPVKTTTISRPATTSIKTSMTTSTTTITYPVKSSISVYETTTPSIITGTESNITVNVLEDATKEYPDFIYVEDFELVPSHTIEEEKEPTPTVDVDIVENFHYITYDEETGVPCTLTKMGIILTVPYKTENNTVSIC